MRRAVVNGVSDEVYIAAKFEGNSAAEEFTIGDGTEVGGYVNRELQNDVEYKAFVRVVIDVSLASIITILMNQQK